MRISGLTNSASPEDTEVGLQVADDYAAELKADGLDLKWSFPANYGESDPADNSGLSREMAGPFKKLLLIQLCSYFGKPAPAEVVKTAAEGMKALENLIVSVPDAQNPSTLPFGSGNEWDYRDRTFYPEPAVNNGADYVFKDDILNFTFDFAQEYPQWILDETLVTVDWEAKDGISIASESFGDTAATAELTFNKVGGYTVKITATKTGTTDKLTVIKNFVIRDADFQSLGLTV